MRMDANFNNHKSPGLFNFKVGIQKLKKRKYSTFFLNKLIIKKEKLFFNVC